MKQERILTRGTGWYYKPVYFDKQGGMSVMTPLLCSELIEKLIKKTPDRVRVSLSDRPSKKALAIRFWTSERQSWGYRRVRWTSTLSMKRTMFESARHFILHYFPEVKDVPVRLYLTVSAAR
jgi:hypothetical protein